MAFAIFGCVLFQGIFSVERREKRISLASNPTLCSRAGEGSREGWGGGDGFAAVGMVFCFD